MTCREFTKKVEDFRLTELTSADPELIAHGNGCASCATLLQERTALAGAMQVLRTRTAAWEAPSLVEQNVLRAFRQNSALQPTSSSQLIPQSVASRFPEFFGWRAYAAIAAVLAIGLGLGIWFAQHSSYKAQQPTAKAVQSDGPGAAQTEHDAQSPTRVASNSRHVKAEARAGLSQAASVTAASLNQSEQAQGYTPLMLCDPISCSGDAEVVRMELPTTAADGSAGSQMADVIVGDDGLVRAIRIVQQQ